MSLIRPPTTVTSTSTATATANCAYLTTFVLATNNERLAKRTCSCNTTIKTTTTPTFEYYELRNWGEGIVQ